MIGFLLVLSAFILAAYFLNKNSKLRSDKIGQKPLPPGPPQLPLIGNAHQIDYPRLHETFATWAKEYGDIVYARVVDKKLIVLNSYDVIKEALIRQGDNFSARPEFWIFSALTDGAGYIRTDGPLWKEQRRHGLHLLRDFGLGRNVQEEKIVDETSELFAEIESSMTPGSKTTTLDPVLNLKFAVVNIINNILFGKRFPYGDEQFTRFQKLFNEVLVLTNRQFPMEFINFLRNFPWLFRQADCRRNFQVLLKYYAAEIKKHRVTLADDLASGKPSDFVYAYLQEIDKRKADPSSNKLDESFSEDQLVQNVSDLFTAGFETTATTLSWYLVYMVNYPEIQNRMRREIQENLGGGVAPDWSDRVKLPYCNAVIAEIQRHANIIPVGVFHSCFADAEVKGYRVPAGSIVVVNHWAAMRDDRVFPEAAIFNPDRFLNPVDGTFSERVDGFIPFGIGKRACMGESLARMELFLFATALLMRYRLKAPPSGVPTLEPYPQFTLAPHPFEITFEKIEE